MNIYFLKYNNYYNRTFRRENSLIDYLDYEVGRTVDVKLFTPGDGVSTSVVANIDLKAAGVTPDYAVVQDDQGDIESLWFVMECRQLRKNQFRIELRRDLVVENIEPLMKCKRFWCDRGLVEDNNDLILQPENISVNRIKRSEKLIKDDSKVAWIVGYLNKSVQGKEITGALDIQANEEADSLSTWPYFQYISNWFNGYTANTNNWFSLYWSMVRVNPLPFVPDYWIRSWDIKLGNVTQNSDISDNNMRWSCSPADRFPSTKDITEAFTQDTTWIDDIRTNFSIKSEEATKNFVGLNNSILHIKDVTNPKYYKVKVISEPVVYEETLNGQEATTEASQIYSICSNKLGGTLKDVGHKVPIYTFHSSGTRYKIKLEELTPSQGFKYTIPADRPHLKDAPYDMFAIPYGLYQGFGSKDLAMRAATAAIDEFNVSASSELYDVQLLPFRPTLSNTKITDITNDLDSNKVIGKIYWATESTFSKVILLDNPIGVENAKFNSIVDLYRLVSPNYSGQFEFTAAANGGIGGFMVDATYMPINPYIRIAPIFDRLYGGEFSDARGLICGGDFSLPVVNNAWVAYQQNNKTYQATFDRSISNLEFGNNIGRKMDAWGIAAGTAQGIVAGASAGGQFGGIWGAVGGAVISGGAALGGGIADINLNEQMRQEQISYIKDQQRLNLAAIQAQPYSLSKTTAFTANNKIFPILEYYTCGPEEREAVRTYLINNSFNIGAVIDFKTLLTTNWSVNDKPARKWIQGHPIEIDTGEDYHYSAELGRELAQGYYFEYWEEN